MASSKKNITKILVNIAKSRKGLNERELRVIGSILRQLIDQMNTYRFSQFAG